MVNKVVTLQLLASTALMIYVPATVSMGDVTGVNGKLISCDIVYAIVPLPPVASNDKLPLSPAHVAFTLDVASASNTNSSGALLMVTSNEVSHPLASVAKTV